MSAKKKVSNSKANPNESPPTSAADEGKAAQDLILEAVFLMMPSAYKKFEQSPHFWDEMLLLAKAEPERALKALRLIGTLVKQGMSSLCFWSDASHSPDVSNDAQNLLADITQYLELLGFVRPEPSSVLRWPAFAARKDDLRATTAKHTALSAIPVFMAHLLKQAEKRVVDFWENPSVPEDPHTLEEWDSGLWHIARYLRTGLGIREGVNEVHKDALFQYLCRVIEFEGFLFEKVLWPLAKHLWPAWARDHEHFSFLGGAKLSNRKRAADGKTDFGIEKLKPQIKSAFKSSMAFSRSFHGGGSLPKAKRPK
jgi:hypothetical protein